MPRLQKSLGVLRVALRKESVDRNGHIGHMVLRLKQVALRKESVDRNMALKRINSSAEDVALRKESVDRNATDRLRKVAGCSRSPQGERG